MKTILAGFKMILSFILSLTMLGGPICSYLDKNVDTDKLRYLAKYAFQSQEPAGGKEATESALAKIGGFAKGLCNPPWDKPLHPTECVYTEEIRDANVEWVRFDMNGIPLNPDGTESAEYIFTKTRIKFWHDKGFKIMLNTSKPINFFEHGVNILTDEGKKELAKQMRYVTEDLQGQVDAIQIANELALSRFRRPLSFDQACEFVGICAKAMAETKKDIIVGTNFGGSAIFTLLEGCKPYEQYLDYWGMDMYLGSFDQFTKFIQLANLCCEGIYNYSGKPVMLNEFGYIGAGAPKSKAEKAAMIQQYGYADEAAARKDIRGFIANLPKGLQEEIGTRIDDSTDEQLAKLVFEGDIKSHLYKEINTDFYCIGYDHTYEGQAKYIKDMLKICNDEPFIIGAFVYNFKDSDACYMCEQEDCPVETGWGMLDLHDNKKPAYYAVQEGFAAIKK